MPLSGFWLFPRACREWRRWLHMWGWHLVPFSKAYKTPPTPSLPLLSSYKYYSAPFSYTFLMNNRSCQLFWFSLITCLLSWAADVKSGTGVHSADKKEMIVIKWNGHNGDESNEETIHEEKVGGCVSRMATTKPRLKHEARWWNFTNRWTGMIFTEENTHKTSLDALLKRK